MELCHDLFRLIFLRLPLHALFKCKIVCRDWSRIIADPLFHREYRLRKELLGRQSAGMFHNIRAGASEVPSVGFVPEGAGIEYDARIRSCFDPAGQPHLLDNGCSVVASSCSFLLCAVRSFTHKRESDLYVCAPWSNEWFLLPAPPYHTSLRSAVSFTALDKENPFSYQVFIIDQFGRVQIYNSSTVEWNVRSFTSDCSWFLAKDFTAITLSKTIFYWACVGNVVVAYNPTINSFHRVALPVTDDDLDKISLGLGPDEQLQLVSLSKEGIDVWLELDGDAESKVWYQKYKIEVTSLLNHLACVEVLKDPHTVVHCFPMHPNKIIIDSGAVSVSYDLDTGDASVIFSAEDLKCKSFKQYFVIYHGVVASGTGTPIAVLSRGVHRRSSPS